MRQGQLYLPLLSGNQKPSQGDPSAGCCYIFLNRPVPYGYPHCRGAWEGAYLIIPCSVVERTEGQKEQEIGCGCCISRSAGVATGVSELGA